VNEDDPELAELQALAEKQDQLNGVASRAKPPPPALEVSREALRALGGKRMGTKIVFGPEGETQLTFWVAKGGVKRPGVKRRRFKQARRWLVSVKGKTSRCDTQRELNKGKRGLWKKKEKARTKKASHLFHLRQRGNFWLAILRSNANSAEHCYSSWCTGYARKSKLNAFP
jgi:hypothetical protein